MENTVFGVVAMSENFVNHTCVIQKIATSSTHGGRTGLKFVAKKEQKNL
jgi:hypothetical protein